MLSVAHISNILERAGALPVYQVAILDFLNRAKVAEDIAGPQWSATGPVIDDPNRFAGKKVGGKGYDIGITVAQRILDEREKRGGLFASLDELAGIPYFGEDKFHDLVYTFVWRRSPIPTGLGEEFDNYIKALGVLELSQLQARKSNTEVLSSVRKLNLDTTTRSNPNSNLNWDDVIPGAADAQPPLSWGLQPTQNQAANTLRRLQSVKVGENPFDAPVLLAGLDARNHAATVRLGSLPARVDSNVQFATFLQGIANATYQYIARYGSSQVSINAEAVIAAYQDAFPLGALIATADAHAIDYEPQHTLSWNMLRYYTTRNGPIKRRFVNLAQSIGLGELKEGLFTGDTRSLREALTLQTLHTAMKILSDNGGGGQVQTMLSRKDSDPTYSAYKNIAGYLTDKFIDEMNLRVSLELFQPAILSWNRLEGRPRTKNLNRALRAEVRDPLWFLARQWQVGEFEGEDTGSAIEMRVDMETVPVNRYSLRKGIAHPYDGLPPVEAIVEREMVDFDLTTSQEMGRHWEKLVRRHLNAFTPADINLVLGQYKANVSLHFTLPTPVANYPEVYSDSARVRRYKSIGGGRLLNGGALYKAVKAGGTGSATTLYLSGPAAAAPIAARIEDARLDFIGWFERVYNQPMSAADDAWAPSNLEYQAQFSAPASSGTRTVLTADEYAQGHLDWYSFDIETDATKSHASLRAAGADGSLIERRTVTVLPGDLRFPGMPLARWWEFEDWKVDLGNIVADTTDVPKLLQAEFALIYSNDWMLLPHDVKVGSICNIKDVVVRDVFGQYTKVRAAGYGDNTDWQRWTMYNLTRRGATPTLADTRLFVPQAVIKTMESEPLEKVTFLRDEMANMVFAIESIIQDGFGGGRDGTEAANQLHDYLVRTAPPYVPPAPPVANTAEIAYKLGTTVPENWIPFIPVRLGGVMSHEIQLRRAAMPRIIPGLPTVRIRPRTDLLKEGYDPSIPKWFPYYVFEEEVPRSGAIVTRTWQRTRGMDGKVYTWLGRRKQNGRGEVNSGLEYDLIEQRKV